MEGSEGKKKSWKAIIILSLVLLIILTAGFFAGNHFYNVAINANNNLFSNSGNEESENSDSDEAKVHKKASEFFETHDVKEEYITASQDDVSLYARSIENEASNVWVVLAHVYAWDGTFMESYAEKFYDMGYSTLIPDFRGHGRSGGNYRAMGWDDRLDLIDWIEYINENYPDSEIVLYGVSMGASAVMMASGEELPENVRAVIEDCGYSSIYEEFKLQVKSMYNLPSFPILNLAGAVTRLRAGYNFMNEGDAVAQVAKSVTPTLFIHGDADTFVPISMMETLYDAASCEREKLVIKGAAHAQSAAIDPELYWDTVEKFLNRHLSYQYNDAAA